MNDEYERLTAYGTQLILTHARLRDLLEDLRDGIYPGDELATHCIAFCDALTEHHTDEDANVFPLLAARHPELRGFLAQLRQDHAIISGLVRGVRQDDPEALSALAAVMETHFRGEEKRLVTVLNEIGG
ncbi:hemerythrin domain-containing protein [Actinoplanes sp. NPDC026619]|uniref:hemerythrin domain-containing protein n=1 Tax=Actinoplanes sp. NPDC026619 TaxID=3155798 RepID=UPI0033F2BADB